MNPIEPTQRHLDIRRRHGTWQLWPCHHHDRQSKLARGRDFCSRRISARILTDHDIDAFANQKALLSFYVKRSACGDHPAMRQPYWRGETIYGTDQIIVVRRGKEGCNFELSDRKENPAPRGTKTARGVGHIGCFDPDIALLPLPGRTFEPQQRNRSPMRGMDCVDRHLCGERMGRINQQVDGIIPQVTPQSLDTTEAANPIGNRRRNDIRGPSGERKLRLEPHIPRKAARKTACFRRSAENEDIKHAGCHDA